MTQQFEVKVPDIGDFSDIPVIEVLVSKGEAVAADQSLLTLESDKATMEIPAPVAGTITEMHVALGDTVSEGDIVVVLLADETVEPPQPVASAPPQVAEPKADEVKAAADKPASTPPVAVKQQPAPPPVGERQSPPVPVGAIAAKAASLPYASPAIRRFARELGVDLARVTGSSRGGRIVREDVKAFVKSVMTGAAAPASSGLGFELPPPPKVNFSRYGEIELQPLSKIQRVSGSYLHRNWVSIPHVTQNDLADITDMEAYRKANAAKALEQGF